MAGQARVIQDEVGTATFQGNKRHLDGETKNSTVSDKSPPSVNDKDIYAGDIFLDLDPQRGGGPQRPLKPTVL